MENPLLKVEKISKRFGESFLALREVSFSVERGDIFGIVGTSGAGKSSLMRCLTCLEPPSEGKIWFENQELTSLSPSSLKVARQKMGKIFQHFNLLNSRTALENIYLPLEISGKKEKNHAEELLDLVGLGEKKNHYPLQLSGGEKQRVAIARALAHRPSVLFSDEATSALDPKNTRLILELLVRLNKALGLTVVLITHQMEVVKEICTKVAVLEEGEIVEKGDVASLFAFPQHPLTKRFLQGAAHPIPFACDEGRSLFRLIFKGKAAKEPVISRLIRNFAIEVNILSGGIDVLQTGTVGNLVVELSGLYDEVVRARLFLEKNGVSCEVLR